MPVTLTETQQTRLAKLAGMLGSSFDGERLAALGKIAQMAEQKKCRIDELLLCGQVTREVVRIEHEPLTEGWRAHLKTILAAHEQQSFLTPWEESFVIDLIVRRRRTPSDKQAVIITRINDHYELVAKKRKG